MQLFPRPQRLGFHRVEPCPVTGQKRPDSAFSSLSRADLAAPLVRPPRGLDSEKSSKTNPLRLANRSQL